MKTEQIHKHGTDLIALFPNAIETDPNKFYHRLRLIEKKAERHSEQLCSSEYYCNHVDHEAIHDRLTDRLHKLCGSDRPWLNQDPRGYALKIDLADGEHLYNDWGGYGIIAPDFTPNN